MEPSTYHTLNDLFSQLGLPNDDDSIENFISSHRPLASNILLQDAPWWNAAQKGFLKSAIIDDADWAIITEQFDQLLR